MSVLFLISLHKYLGNHLTIEILFSRTNLLNKNMLLYLLNPIY